MHLMSAERRCFEDLTATLHDGASDERRGGVDQAGQSAHQRMEGGDDVWNVSLAFCQTALVEKLPTGDKSQTLSRAVKA